MSDPIWLNDFNILFKRDRMMEFFPSKSQTHEERINAIVRLSLYISILLTLYHSNGKYMGIFIFLLGFTSMLSKYDKEELNKDSITIEQQMKKTFIDEKTKPHLNNFTPSLGLNIEKLENEKRPDDTDGKCIEPTIDNPFMNVTMKDYMNLDKNGKIIDRPPACDPNDKDIKEMMDESFNNNLYRDVSDVFGKMSSQRNYYTMPWTTIPNNQNEFAKWLYLNPKTCKEDQDNCLLYEDIRNKRQILPNADKNPVSSKKFDAVNDTSVIENIK